MRLALLAFAALEPVVPTAAGAGVVLLWEAVLSLADPDVPTGAGDCVRLADGIDDASGFAAAAVLDGAVLVCGGLDAVLAGVSDEAVLDWAVLADALSAVVVDAEAVVVDADCASAFDAVLAAAGALSSMRPTFAECIAVASSFFIVSSS